MLPGTMFANMNIYKLVELQVLPLIEYRWAQLQRYVTDFELRRDFIACAMEYPSTRFPCHKISFEVAAWIYHRDNRGTEKIDCNELLKLKSAFQLMQHFGDEVDYSELRKGVSNIMWIHDRNLVEFLQQEHGIEVDRRFCESMCRSSAIELIPTDQFHYLVFECGFVSACHGVWTELIKCGHWRVLRYWACDLKVVPANPQFWYNYASTTTCTIVNLHTDYKLPDCEREAFTDFQLFVAKSKELVISITNNRHTFKAIMEHPELSRMFGEETSMTRYDDAIMMYSIYHGDLKIFKRQLELLRSMVSAPTRKLQLITKIIRLKPKPEEIEIEMLRELCAQFNTTRDAVYFRLAISNGTTSFLCTFAEVDIPVREGVVDLCLKCLAFGEWSMQLLEYARDTYKILPSFMAVVKHGDTSIVKWMMDMEDQMGLKKKTYMPVVSSVNSELTALTYQRCPESTKYMWYIHADHWNPAVFLYDLAFDNIAAFAQRHHPHMMEHSHTFWEGIEYLMAHGFFYERSEEGQLHGKSAFSYEQPERMLGALCSNPRFFALMVKYKQIDWDRIDFYWSYGWKHVEIPSTISHLKMLVNELERANPPWKNMWIGTVFLKCCWQGRYDIIRFLKQRCKRVNMLLSNPIHMRDLPDNVISCLVHEGFISRDQVMRVCSPATPFRF